MSIMVSIDCVVCGIVTGQVSLYDIPYISNNTCLDCLSKFKGNK